MILSNVNIGSGPSAGDGDPLRSAFNTINSNFAKIESNVNALTNSVSSVAGRTGNVTLTVNDVIGAASIAYVNSVASGNANIVVTPYSNSNVQSYLTASNYATQSDIGNANVAMKSYVDTQIAGVNYTNSNVNAYLSNFDGNIVPSANVTYDLGSSTNRWRDLWLSGNTIHIGDASLSVSAGAIQSSLPIVADLTASNLTVTGTRLDFGQGSYVEETPVIGRPGTYGLALNSSDDGIVGMNALDSNAEVTSSVIVSNVSVQINVANSTPGGNALVWMFDQSGSVQWPDGTTQSTASIGGGGNANTGNVTFSDIKIIGAGTASGDGLGYSTLELVPDGTLVSDQYIIVDPTAPNHIHLRAGGTQDASTAALFLGGELNYARVTDGNGVRLNNAQFIPDTAYFAVTTDYDSATWSTDESGNHWIDIIISDPFNPTRDPNPINTAGSRFAQYPTRNSIEVFTGSSLYTVIGNGQAYTLGNPYNYRIGTTQAPPVNPTTLASLDYRLNTFAERYLFLENNNLEAYANNAYVYADQTIDLITGSGNIRIITDDNNNSRTWDFGADGYLTLPQVTSITTQAAIRSAGDIVINANDTGQWKFTTSGNIQLPIGGDIIRNGVSVLGGGGSSYGNVDVANYLSNYDGSITFTASPAIISGLGLISTNDANVTGVVTVGVEGACTSVISQNGITVWQMSGANTAVTATGISTGGVYTDNYYYANGTPVTFGTGYAQDQNLTTTSNVTFSTVTTTGQIVESFQTYSSSISANATATLNCVSGSLWNITSSVTGNWVAGITNLEITTGQATSVTLVINQGATGYIPNAITINGTGTTINWQGGATPIGNANKKDVISFSIMQTGAGTYLVFGQLVTFG